MMTHDEVWDRIPWLVNGRADETEREHLEAHLRICEECRIEVAVQRQVMGAIANDKRIDVVPGAAFQRLWDRISASSIIDDDEEDLDALEFTRGAPPPPRVTVAEPEASAPSQPRNRSITRWLAAAVIVEAIGLVALATALSSRSVDSQPAAVVSSQPSAIANGQPSAIANDQPSAEYRTVTSSAPQAASQGVIRAVFQPNLRVSDLQQLLEQSGLQIVSGPTEAGVYTLAGSAAEGPVKVDTALTELRSHPSVRFAEPVGK